MRSILTYLFASIISVLLHGCGDSKQNIPLPTATSQQEVVTTPAPKDTVVEPVTNEQTLPKEDSNYEHQTKAEGFITTFKEGNTLQKWRIYQNVITFFIPNENQKDVELLAKKGFPMEFWGEGMCSFYTLPVNKVDSMRNVAAKLGFKNYGYVCESVTDKDWPQRILSNQLYVQFNPDTPIDYISAMVMSAKFYDVQVIADANTYMLRVKNGSARNIVAAYDKLSRDKNVMRVEYSFKTCKEPEVTLH